VLRCALKLPYDVARKRTLLQKCGGHSGFWALIGAHGKNDIV
jgi:hypothetical protein